MVTEENVQEVDDEMPEDEQTSEFLMEQPFAGYEVQEKIGQGGYAAVFLARDIRLDRKVAIKALIPDLAANEDAVELFFTEAGNVARIRHPNIVRGLDVGRAGKYFFFVMEYIKGESVAQKLNRMERSRLSEKDALKIIYDVAVGLQEIFENGLVHRDIKPGNILIDKDGNVKICDLGIAREVAFANESDALIGSPSYSSPEQARGDIDIDTRSDLYSLGCMWFHMIIGYPPFRGHTPEQILDMQMNDEAPNLREIDVRISAATSQLVAWLLTKDRDYRPRTPQQFLSKLKLHPMLAREPESEVPEVGESDNVAENDDENLSEESTEQAPSEIPASE